MVVSSGKTSVINNKRLRDYPRIFFIATWIILAFSLIFRQGWLSAFNQVIGSDFVTLYAAGMVHRTDLPNLYNLATQYDTQQALIEPTTLPGLNPFISPPYVAAAYSLFTYLPLPVALVLWSVLSLLFTMAAVYLLIKQFRELSDIQVSFWQLLIITVSFFPWIEGFLAGQNHTLTLLLVTCIILLSLYGKWAWAGALTGLLIYKPQLVIGFLIIWIIWRKFKAVAAFLSVSLLILGFYILVYGISPIQEYFAISNQLLLLPYVPGFPGYLLLTFYGLLATIFPFKAIMAIRIITTALSILVTGGLCWLAYKLRDKPFVDRSPAQLLAIGLPLVAFPYALLHDILVLIPGLILWLHYQRSKGLLYTVIVIYLGGLFLTLISTVTKIAFVSFLSIGLVVMIFIYVLFVRSERTRSSVP